MKSCITCKHRNTPACDPCDDRSLWEDSGNTFPFIISAMMFGCGMGGVIAFVYAFFYGFV